MIGSVPRDSSVVDLAWYEEDRVTSAEKAHDINVDSIVVHRERYTEE